jgi:hypothetical protein
VLGFAGMTEEQIDESIRRMAALLRPLVERTERAWAPAGEAQPAPVGGD